MIEFMHACSALFELAHQSPKKKKRRIVKAWTHCRRKGCINGYQVSGDIKKAVGGTAKAIKAIPDSELRKSLRDDISRELVCMGERTKH